MVYHTDSMCHITIHKLPVVLCHLDTTIRSAILLLIFLWYAVSAHAQELFASPFPFEHLLYSNQVYKIFQDDSGFIWLGTTSSLERWDGHRLLTFRSDGLHPNLLADNNIRDIAETPALLWVVGQSNLSLYDKSTGRFFVPSDRRLASQHIRGIHADGHGGMWLASPHLLYHCNSTCSKILTVNPFAHANDKHDITAIYVDRNGFLWVMCYDGLVLKGKGNRFESLPPIPGGGWICTIYQDTQGRYWMGTWGKGLWQYIPANNSWKQHQVFNNATNNLEDIFFCIRQDKVHGWLWMLSYKRLYVLAYHNGHLIPVNVSGYITPLKYYTNELCDKDGNIWLTSYDGGYILNFNTSGIRNYLQFQSSDDTDETTSIYYDGDWIWHNCLQHGLQLVNSRNGSPVSVQPDPAELFVMAPARQKQSVWVAQRYNPVVYRIQRQSTKATVMEKVNLENTLGDTEPIKDMAEDSEGVLWMLNSKHLVARASQPDGNLYTADLAHPSAIALTGKGGVFCTAGKKLAYCLMEAHHVACRNVASLPFLKNNEEVMSMAVEATGAVWIATTLGRTFRSDRKQRTFKPSPLDGLLQDGQILDLLIKGTKVWAMNNKRLVSYDTSTGIINHYDASTGNIKIKGFRNHALCDAPNGIMAGGVDGFMYLPDKAATYPATAHPISIVLTNAIINGTSLFFNNKPTTSSTFRHLILPADAHNIELHLSTLTYAGCHTQDIQYRTDGMDDSWTDIDAKMPVVHYNRLPRGIFTLQVRFKQDCGAWGDPHTVATIERLPAWYETYWAIACFLFAIVLLVLFIIKYIRHRYSQDVQNEVAHAKVSIITTDHKLADKVVKVIDEHLDNSNFGVEQILEEVGMSKSSLYRQLKTETGMTPLDLIRSVRMKRATELLLSHQHTISEVAYATGFSTPKYFTKCFKSEFGQTPSDYIRMHSVNNNGLTFD